MALDRRFRYAYRYSPSFSGGEHQYEVIGRDGAIQFHVTKRCAVPEITGLPDYYGGLEFHRRQCPDYENRPPSHHDCRLTGGICWHDGTSLYASETLIPRWQLDFPDHDAIFGWLVTEFDRAFPVADEMREGL